jgi:hypothetical protein
MLTTAGATQTTALRPTTVSVLLRCQQPKFPPFSTY